MEDVMRPFRAVQVRQRESFPPPLLLDIGGVHAYFYGNVLRTFRKGTEKDAASQKLRLKINKLLGTL